MKYIEELKCGDKFRFKDSPYVLSIDFKKNGDRLAINLQNGSGVWISSQAIVESLSVFTLDQENNLTPL